MIVPDPATPPGVSGNIAAAPLADPGPIQFTVAGYNVERFFDTVNDPAIGEPVLTATAFNNRLNKLSLAVRNVLRTPDVVGMVEVENLATLQSIATRINNDSIAAGDPSPAYTAYLEEGNDVGGIDVGFLVKSARISVVDVTQIGKDATYAEPGGNPTAILNDRPSLALRAEIPRAGAPPLPVTVIVNHLRSLSGVDDPLDGDRVRTKRRAQAEFLANHVQSRQAANPDERIVLVGDFNAFQFNDGYVDSMGTLKGTPAPASQVTLASPDLVSPDLVNLVETIPASERYSFSFDGNAQVLDHALVTGNLSGLVASTQFVRVDADFPESLRNDPLRPERISDHDPLVVTFNLPAATQTVLGSAPNPSAFGEAVTFTATVSTSDTPVTEGTVTFSEGSTPLGGPVALDPAGQATFTTSTLGAGPHTITATYSGTATLDGSSGSVVQTVGPAPSQTVVVSSPNPSGFGQLVTFTATVTSAGSPVIQGTVTFFEGPTVLAGPAPVNAAGQAAFATSGLAVGSHPITAEYSGTPLVMPSSGSVVQVVQAGLSVADAYVVEGSGTQSTLPFVVTLMPAAAQPVTVSVATADGTAKAGSDYASRLLHLTFPPGSTRLSVNVPVNGDGVAEGDETMLLRLTGAANASITDGEAVGTILNDDALPTVRVIDRVAREGHAGTTPFVFFVTLSAPSTSTVTLNYTTVDGSAVAGSDYVATAGTLSFPPGTDSRSVTVLVKGDPAREPHEYFFLQTSGAVGAAVTYGRGIGTIINDDGQPPAGIDDASRPSTAPPPPAPGERP
jgi:hypothetical protein